MIFTDSPKWLVYPFQGDYCGTSHYAIQTYAQYGANMERDIPYQVSCATAKTCTAIAGKVSAQFLYNLNLTVSI